MQTFSGICSGKYLLIKLSLLQGKAHLDPGFPLFLELILQFEQECG
jgi:hypothetical protein